MSLLTPPSTSHRSDKEKENKFQYAIAGPSTRSVVWAEETSVHDLSTPIRPTCISSKKRPASSKSILKKATAYNRLLAVPSEPVKPREVTPQPVDPLVNLHYLDRPVSQILAEVKEGDSVSELIEGYNVLALRLRTSVTESVDADASWPLFQPLRKNKEAFINAVVRDLGRALVDPLLQFPSDESSSTPTPKFTPPSPKSPMKKRDGMTAEQVKYARDLCTICHSVLKMLGVAFSYSSIFSIFDERSLRRVLTAVLAIPLADSLPTPNARKTCALAIWLIQVQRLPAEVVRPAADRIAYALRRGLDGELGKEGKKGSANDGLKAIHDLCVFQPETYTIPFVSLLQSILANLLANQLVIRTQACHALGGFVIGATSIPLSERHTTISNIVANFLTTLPVSKSPTKSTEPMIVRTLRTTLTNPDPLHVAQGPVWALSVLASFTVLLHSRICTDVRVNKLVISLLNIALQSKKGTIRSLCHMVWRPLTWVYFQPPLPADSDEESEIDEDHRQIMVKTRNVFWQVVSNVVDYRTGVSTIAALLGEAPDSEESLRAAFKLLRNMATPGSSCPDAVDVVHHMVSMTADKCSWDINYLLPPSLFSSNPGLLTMDLKGPNSPLQTIFEEVAGIEDVRCLTRDEIAKPWVFKGMMSIWWSALSCLQLSDNTEVPTPLVEIWEMLLTHRLSFLQDNEDAESIASFANEAVGYILEVIEHPELNFVLMCTSSPGVSPVPDLMTLTMEGSGQGDQSPISSTEMCTNGELRLRVVHTLWVGFKKILPTSAISGAAEKLLNCIMRNHSLLLHPSALVFDSNSDRSPRDFEHGSKAREEWVSLTMDIISLCDAEALKVFWGFKHSSALQSGTWGSGWSEEFRVSVWKTSVECWKEHNHGWESAIVLLGVPFTDRHAWDAAGEDFTFWSEFFESYVVAHALDYDVDSCTIIDKLASFVLEYQSPGHVPSALRFVDYLLSLVDASEIRDVPANFLDLVSQTMRAAYPPEPRKMQIAGWLMRSLSSFIESCPDELVTRVLELLEESLVLWIQDEYDAWTDALDAYDTVPLYQHILIKIQGQPVTDASLEQFSHLIGSIFRHRAPPAAIEAFTDFWKLTFASQDEPNDGWPEPVHNALVAVGLIEDFPAVPCTPISSSFSSPPAAVVKREALARISSPQRPTKQHLTFPVIPTSPETPIRRRRTSSSSVHGVVTSGGIRRTPLSSMQLCNTGSPSKRRKLAVAEGEEAKENVQIPSVLERIAGLGAANGKKRRFDDDGEEEQPSPAQTPSSLMLGGKIAFPSSGNDELEPTPTKNLKKKMRPRTSKPITKKPRIASPAPSNSSNESDDDRRWVEHAVLHPAGGLPFPSVEDDDEIVEKMTPHLRTRTIATSGQPQPTLSDIDEIRTFARQDRAASFHQDSSSTTPSTPVRKIDLTKYLAKRRTGTIRRSVSVPESIGSGGAEDQKKRKRVDSLDADDVDEMLSTSKPLPALSIPPLGTKPVTPWWMKRATIYNDVEMIGSDDSDITTVAAPASSDDDPHLGQVTPYHLISPQIMRKKISASTCSALRLKGLHVSAASVKTYRSAALVSKELFGDDENDMPGSDDSIATSSGSETDSPTKRILLRHLQKTPSSSSLSMGSSGRAVTTGI